ncbi:MAG TPA: aldehyde reductase [Caulobacterales bacterium]|nr:aldehyde reductase [Caulobacterales bacterium]
MNDTVLVTGGSGFIASYCILDLLAAGYAVKTTVRNLKREPEVRATLASAGAQSLDRLSFVAADLEKDDGWADAVAGCAYVLHVASPFPQSAPKHEDDLIRPAREGALRVLRAAKPAGVKRVVLTSSFAAIGYGHPPMNRPFTENDWSVIDGGDMRAYAKSKTLAERAAWDFVKGDGAGMELSVVNPVGVLGPVLGADFSTSILIVQKLMDGAMPGCPRFSFGIVDVRDVASLHILAMTRPEAAGERFLAVAGPFMSMLDIAKVLKARMGAAAKRVPTKELPDWMVKLAALADPAVAQLVPELGKTKQASNDKARGVLGWKPRSNEDAIVATAESLIRLGLLKDSKKAA